MRTRVKTDEIEDGAVTAAKLHADAVVKGAGVFYENDQTVASNYTITAGKNAMSAGPIEIANGIEVTVPNGSTWTIV